MCRRGAWCRRGHGVEGCSVEGGVVLKGAWCRRGRGVEGGGDVEGGMV